MCRGQKEIVKCMVSCIMGPFTNPPLHRPSWWHTKKVKKAILCLVYGRSLRAERYVSPEKHFVLWNLIAAVADRKWDRVFHFPVAIFTHKLNKDPFATGPRLHLPTIHIAKGRRQFCNQECNLHHEFHIHGKCWKATGSRALMGREWGDCKTIDFTF